MDDPDEFQLKNLHIWLQQLVHDDAEGGKRTPQDLTDGVSISKCLGVLAPDFFDEEWVTKINKKAVNWRVATNNIRKVTSKLQDYYEQVCEEELSDFDWPDPNAIGERKDLQQLRRLLQLVVGVVFCRKQEADILQIRQLGQEVQKSIMDVYNELQQQFPSSCFGLVESEDSGADELSARLAEVCAANRRLEERTQQLEVERGELQRERDALAADNERLSSLQSATDGPAASSRLKDQIDDLQQLVRRLENERDEAEMAREQFSKTSDRHEDTIRQLRQQNHELLEEVKDDTALQDELDILRKRVRDYETQVERYRQKLDGLSEVRQRLQAAEEDRNRQEQQIKELEEKSRLSTASKSQLDLYRQKVEDLEDSVSAEAKRAIEAELASRKAREKLEQTQRQLKRVEDEVTELQEQQSRLKSLPQQGSVDLEGLEASRAENERLRAELDELRRLSAESDVKQQVDSLQSELVYRDELQDKLRKQIRSLQTELTEVQNQLDEVTSAGAGAATDTKTSGSSDSTVVADLKRTLADVRLQAKTLKADLEQRNKKLEDKSNETNVLKDKLGRREEELVSLHNKYKSSQEKAKSTIKVLQQNQEQTLQRFVQERDQQVKNLEERCKLQEEKAEKMREGFEIEQRVLVSSWSRACENLQKLSAQTRLAALTDSSCFASAMPESFLARQRQALLHQQTTAMYKPNSGGSGSKGSS